ncbi:MAG: Sir2 family NAD-dependent protein deacetylase [Bacillota bacterium]
MSTACGIPDFRSNGGIWQGSEGKENMKLFSNAGFRQSPGKFYKLFRQLFEIYRDINIPGPYEYLKRLGDNRLRAVIATQNVDGLHNKYASSNFEIYEVHGTAFTCSCTKCGSKLDTDYILDNLASGYPQSRCCKAVIKPDMILFDDALPGQFHAVSAAAQDCDFVLVLGSSLAVTTVPKILEPFSQFQRAIVNLQPTPFDSKFGIVIHGDITEVLKQLCDYLTY